MSERQTSVKDDRKQINQYIASATRQWIDHLIRHHRTQLFSNTPSHSTLEPGNAINNSLTGPNWACFHCYYLDQRITIAEEYRTELDEASLREFCYLFDNIPSTARICINFRERLERLTRDARLPIPSQQHARPEPSILLGSPYIQETSTAQSYPLATNEPNTTTASSESSTSTSYYSRTEPNLYEPLEPSSHVNLVHFTGEESSSEPEGIIDRLTSTTSTDNERSCTTSSHR